MTCREIEKMHLPAFSRYLQGEERERGTIEKYRRDIEQFVLWLGECPVTAEAAVSWKEYLRAAGYKPESINGKLSALNKI